MLHAAGLTKRGPRTAAALLAAERHAAVMLGLRGKLLWDPAWWTGCERMHALLKSRCIFDFFTVSCHCPKSLS